MQNKTEISTTLPKGVSTQIGWKPILILCGAIFAIRLLSIFFMGLMPQDAYYDFYAEHLALSYYDHPPMIAYVLRLFTALFGKKVIVVKLADTVVTVLTIIAFYHLARKFLSERKSKIATALLISTFMISILSLISTPDVPLMCCWVLSLFFLHEAIFGQKKTAWMWAGIFSGLSFDSKYTGIFLVIGLLGFLMLSKAHRKYLISSLFLIYLVLFFITILPVVIWNFRNGFASFKFQSEGRVKEGLQFDPLGLLGVLGHQTAILLPLLFASLCYFIFRIVRKYKMRVLSIPPEQLFLFSFFIPLFAGFFSISLIYWVKLNWMMPAYITGIIWVSRYWNMKWLRAQLTISVVVHILLAIEIIFYIVPVKSDDTWFGWSQLAEAVKLKRKEYPNAFIFSADDYKTSAVLNFYLPDMIYSKNVVGERALQFDFVGTRLQDLNGKDALFIDSKPRFDNLANENNAIPFFYYRYFDRIIPLNPILIEKNGKIERKFSVFLCTNYRFLK